MEKELEKENTVESECTCEEHCCSHGEDACTCACCESEENDSEGSTKSKKPKKQNKDKTKIEALEQKVKELEDKLLREKAEMINYRKRKEEDVARMLKFSNEDLITEMLPVIDNFESAIKMDDDNLEDEVSKFLQGFKMIYCNLVNILEKYDVKVIDGNHKPFDPTYHQAVMTEKSDLEPGMVIEVLRKGYILKDKVLRPAMVKVSE